MCDHGWSLNSSLMSLQVCVPRPPMVLFVLKFVEDLKSSVQPFVIHTLVIYTYTYIGVKRKKKCTIWRTSISVCPSSHGRYRLEAQEVGREKAICQSILLVGSLITDISERFLPTLWSTSSAELSSVTSKTKASKSNKDSFTGHRKACGHCHVTQSWKLGMPYNELKKKLLLNLIFLTFFIHCEGSYHLCNHTARNRGVILVSHNALLSIPGLDSLTEFTFILLKPYSTSAHPSLLPSLRPSPCLS